MLQQTRVETVIPYFERFLARFPDVQTLANATQDEVLALWSGLGYYARGRNLHKAARQICAEFSGNFPQTLDEMVTLSGIGRSTAAAILSLAFELPEPILDGNVKRVFCRHFGIEGWPGKSAVTKTLWQIAENEMPQQQCGVYTQAIMDLGATCCLPKNPQCEICPVSQSCIAHQKGRTEELPTPSPKKQLPVRTVAMIILQNTNGEILLQRRPETGIWGGLWSFPELEAANEWEKWCENQLQKSFSEPEIWQPFTHIFTHFKLEITPLYVQIDQNQADFPKMEESAWIEKTASENLGLAAPVRKLIQKLESF